MVLLPTGRKDGYLCVINMKNGQVEFAIEGHGSKGVLSMIANSPDDQVVSAGLGESSINLSYDKINGTDASILSV